MVIMKDQLYIKYYKWNSKQSSELFKSCQEHFEMADCQFYMPIFSLFFYIHNTKRSHKTIDFKRRYYIQNIKEIIKEKYYNSNIILEGSLYDSHKNITKHDRIFCKTIPILDPMHCINNNYNCVIARNQLLPSLYNYNTFQKINNMNNTAYIDVFCSYIASELTIQQKLPSFPLFYGSLNGQKTYKYDISEEYYDLRVDKCFNKNIGKGFNIDIYISDSESDNSDSDSDDESDYNDDYIAHIKNIPVQLLFIEQLEGTLEDLIHEDNFSQELLISGLFQITFALAYMQKYYKFTHNDLHINNIMYKYTDKKFLYYKINNTYFKVPTFGRIFKIIDFGRAIFTFKQKTYMNDVFSREGEAGGQYAYPYQVDFLQKKSSNNIQPNYHFDLCRLSITILDEIKRLDESPMNNTMMSFLQLLVTDCNNNSLCDCEDDFNLYINIAKNANHALPRDIINHSIFKQYRITKKMFPKKSYYSM